ncbi:MAG: DciA family protein [Gammaproteobacteria bacterium]
MTAKSLKQWCRSVLPADFDQVNADISKIQQFLIENIPEPINQQLRVMNLTQDEIVVATTDPQIANYLRLYASEIEQQIRETLNLSRKLKFRSMPDSIFQVEPHPGPNKTTAVSPDTVDAIDRSADCIEDEKLKQALQSLVQTLKQK